MEQRARLLLKRLIEQHINDGQPVGSRALAKISGLDISPATVRNIMSDLEEAGFLSSPHTSAGRIPTEQGYRFFVNSLLTIHPPHEEHTSSIKQSIKEASPHQLLTHVSHTLSELTHFASVVVVPQREMPRFRLIEFIALSDQRILLIIVSENGDVQNRVLQTKQGYNQDMLDSAAQYINEHCSGLTFVQIREHLHHELQTIHDDIKPLLVGALEASQDSTMAEQQCVISGEKNFLDIDEFSNNMDRLRQLFLLFEQRASIIQLLDHSQGGTGVQIYIGKESGISPLDECSVVTASCEVDKQIVGTLGVIGPTRMAYERVIPIVDVTARLLSSTLTYHNRAT